MTFSVPAAPAGPYSVSVTGATSGFETTAIFSETPAISLEYGTSGPAQSEMSASVSGFSPGETVAISYASSTEGTCTADSSGGCWVDFVEPSDPTGLYSVSALGQTSGETASVTFTETPTLSLSASLGPEGSDLGAHGGGFVPGETVDITYAGSAVASCTADATGACTASFNVPAAPSGSYTVTATGAISGIPVSTHFMQYGVLSVGVPSGPQGSSFSANVAGLSADETVEFQFYGPADVASCTTNSIGDCSATIVVPALPSGTYGISANDPSDDSIYASFQIIPALTLTPNLGPVRTTVSATATGFGGPGGSPDTVEFSFDGTEVASCPVDRTGDCSTTFAAPAELAGTYTVSALGLDSGLSSAATFTETPPSVTSISPDEGERAAGTEVTITGTGFTRSSVVDFGTEQATSVAIENSTTILAKSPAGVGTVDVTVTTPEGTSATSPTDQFNYLPVPKVSAISPAGGPRSGGATVTISGKGFANPATVAFGTSAASTVTVENSTTIAATSPPGKGTVIITVSTPGGTSAETVADDYSYRGSPSVTEVMPASGPLGGGTIVTIIGSKFTSSATVSFGGVPATKVTVTDGSRISAKSPPGRGAVDITVTTLGGTSATSPTDRFTYVGTS
jgi:hypothetical protein